ncbi:glycosyltransferase [Bacteroides congonensis]
MKRPKIKYFSYRGCPEPDRQRDNSPAADTKIDYIIEVLNRIGYDVDHISRAQSTIDQYIPSYVEKNGNNTYRYFASFGKTKSFLRIFNRWFMELQFFGWCLFNIKRNEKVLVYHSLGYDSAFIKLKKLKNIHIIGDIEEIYQDVSKQKPSKERDEYRFIDICDKYMFSNTILNERLNNRNKPYLVVHGIYRINEYEPISYNDGKIHILYAGTYDPNKGGALISVKVAKYLNDNYHLHITGFGSSKQAEEIRVEVERVKAFTKCDITFHGYLNNIDFLDLMHHCSIGLCTQDPTSLLNLTSFPSKILNYMANGLVVLTGRNRAIMESAVADLVYYYDEQKPEDIARGIVTIVNPQGYECRERLIKLNADFENELKNILAHELTK